MARNAGENNRTRHRASFDILLNVRGRHGIFPTPRSWRISAGFGYRRRILRNENRYPGRCRLPTLRNLELCAYWFRISSQSRLLARQRLSGNWTERGLDHWDAALAKCLRLSRLHESGAFRRINTHNERKSDARNEAYGADRARAAHARRNFRFGAERLHARNG